MHAALCFALALIVASCANARQDWSTIEGCWRQREDHWPMYMRWRADPTQPGAFIGEWQREAAQGDVARLIFTLSPTANGMQLCERDSERCQPAVFGRAGWLMRDVAVLNVEDGYHEFGYAGATQPLFHGYRAACG